MSVNCNQFLLSSTRFNEIDIEKDWGGTDTLGTTKSFPRVKNKYAFLAKVKNVSIFFSNLFLNWIMKNESALGPLFNITL